MGGCSAEYVRMGSGSVGQGARLAGCAAATMGAAINGYTLCVVAGAVPLLSTQFGLSTLEKALVISLNVVGAMAGGIVGGFLADAAGRKPGLAFCGAAFGLSAMMMALAPSFTILLAGRFIAGLGTGVSGVVNPIYLSEVAPPSLRGTLVTANEILLTVGCLFALGALADAVWAACHGSALPEVIVHSCHSAHCPGVRHEARRIPLVSPTGVSYLFKDATNGWRLMLGGAGPPSILLLLTLPLVPESPIWAAQRALQREQQSRARSHCQGDGKEGWFRHKAFRQKGKHGDERDGLTACGGPLVESGAAKVTVSSPRASLLEGGAPACGRPHDTMGAARSGASGCLPQVLIPRSPSSTLSRHPQGNSGRLLSSHHGFSLTMRAPAIPEAVMGAEVTACTMGEVAEQALESDSGQTAGRASVKDSTPPSIELPSPITMDVAEADNASDAVASWRAGETAGEEDASEGGWTWRNGRRGTSKPTPSAPPVSPRCVSEQEGGADARPRLASQQCEHEPRRSGKGYATDGGISGIGPGTVGRQTELISAWRTNDFSGALATAAAAAARSREDSDERHSDEHGALGAGSAYGWWVTPLRSNLIDRGHGSAGILPHVGACGTNASSPQVYHDWAGADLNAPAAAPSAPRNLGAVIPTVQLPLAARHTCQTTSRGGGGVLPPPSAPRSRSARSLPTTRQPVRRRLRSSHSVLFAAQTNAHLPAAVESAPPPAILSLPSVPTTIFLQPIGGATAPADLEGGGPAGDLGKPSVSSLGAALRDPQTRRPLLVAVGLGVGNNLIMVQALQGFTTDILLQAGASDPFLSALWAGLARLGGVAVCVFLVDRVGRRPLLIGGAAAIAASYAAMAKAFAADSPLLLAYSLILLFFAWSGSWAGLVWTVSAELLPDSLRAQGMGLAIIMFWVLNFVACETIQELMHELTPSVACSLFCAMSFLALGFVIAFVPETREPLLAAEALIAASGPAEAVAPPSSSHPSSLHGTDTYGELGRTVSENLTTKAFPHCYKSHSMASSHCPQSPGSLPAGSRASDPPLDGPHPLIERSESQDSALSEFNACATHAPAWSASPSRPRRGADHPSTSLL